MLQVNINRPRVARKLKWDIAWSEKSSGYRLDAFQTLQFASGEQTCQVGFQSWSAGWEDRAKAGAFVAAIAYRKGAAVTLVGLKTQELNGQSGVVVKELSAATGRIGVKLDSRRVVAVKPTNLSRT